MGYGTRIQSRRLMTQGGLRSRKAQQHRKDSKSSLHFRRRLLSVHLCVRIVDDAFGLDLLSLLFHEDIVLLLPHQDHVEVFGVEFSRALRITSNRWPAVCLRVI